MVFPLNREDRSGCLHGEAATSTSVVFKVWPLDQQHHIRNLLQMQIFRALTSLNQNGWGSAIILTRLLSSCTGGLSTSDLGSATVVIPASWLCPHEVGR